MNNNNRNLQDCAALSNGVTAYKPQKYQRNFLY